MSYVLIWSDEFDKGHLDLNKWQIDVGGGGFGNNEAQYYTDRSINCRIENERLVIEAHKEDYENRHYTSAKITTYGKFSFKYGKLEVVAKLPHGKGTWPAVWLLPDSIKEGVKWPLCGEIDVVEHVGRGQDVMHFSLHTGAYNHNLNSQYTSVHKLNGVSEEFKKYTMIWEEDYIEFKVDDVTLCRFTKGEDGKDASEKGWPFNQPFFLIINLAMGGNWGGEIDDRILPQKLEIEYVRIFEKRE
ncbi:MAG TPA: glycoside hydrolase [Clostridiales bacterium UBA8960]|jgi:beta-glucanase (GH16 family)|nr:glycoside hydrolase [Clostridiales bacterium UBA8960]